MPNLHIHSLQIGQPRTYGDPAAADSLDQPFTSSIFKQPVSGPVFVDFTHLAGDAQADLRVHGGVDKAIYSYPAAHYPLWQAELALPDMPFGGFGENLTLTGVTEADVCVGDTYQAGEVVIQIAQPRRPCYKLGRRWHVPDMMERFDATGRCGWYCRVLHTGSISAGQDFVLVERPAPQFSVAACHAIVMDTAGHLAEARALAVFPLLADAYRSSVVKRLERLAGG